jgi:uncharacterized protein DUF4394
MSTHPSSRPPTRMIRRLAALALAGGAVFGTVSAVPASGDASAPTHSRDCGSGRWSSSDDVVGLTSDQRLICFDSDRPERARTIGTLSGLAGDTRLVGIDMRPANGLLYGVGDQGGIYTIDTSSADATKVAQSSVALRGTSFGVDFNPAADRLRVVSDVGQNLRINVDAGGAAIADGDLAYTQGTPATGVSAAAYTNNDADPATATTLFDIDSMLDQVAVQSPPNNGSLVATGALGEDTDSDVSFDIRSRTRRDTTVSNTAFASLSSSDGTYFAEVDLLTGRADVTGRFSNRNDVVAVAVTLG